MNWNYGDGSYKTGKSFNGEGLPDSDRAWFESYEFGAVDNLEQAIVGDYFYYAVVKKGMVLFKKICLSDGVTSNEVLCHQVSYTQVSADERFISAGGVALSIGDFEKKFDQAHVDPNVRPDTIAELSVSGGNFYCSEPLGSPVGLTVIKARETRVVNYVDKATRLLAHDGFKECVLSGPRNVFFYSDSDDYSSWEKPVDGSTVALGFSDDWSFYMKVSGCVFRARRSNGRGWDVVHLCNAEASDFSDCFIYEEYIVVVSREKMSIDVYDRFSGEHAHSHPIKVNKIVSGFMRGGIYYSNYDHHPVGYDVMSGELVWRSEDRVTTSKVIGTSKALIYKFVGGGYQCYYMG